MVPAAPAAEPDILAIRARLERRLAELKADRAEAEPDWLDIVRYIAPERGRFLPLSQAFRKKPRRAILDPTGSKAWRRLAAFCMAAITNPSLAWFKLGLADAALADDDEVRAWLSEVVQRIEKVLADGTFYPSLHQGYEEMGGFGTAVILALDDSHDLTRWYPLTIGEYWLDLNDRQEVDTVYREYSLSVAQIVKQFGKERCSPAVQGAYDQNRLSMRVVVVHAIEPNRDRRPAALGWRGAAWTGVYYERGNPAGVLRMEAHHQRPFLAPRWDALSGEAYGTGPGHQALADVKSLQVSARQLSEAAEKLVQPPMQADARNQNNYQGLWPGDVNWIPGLDQSKAGGIRPIFTVPPNPTVLQEETERYRKVILEAFFNDLILAISQMEGVQPRNEMEIAERRQEKMLMLGPMLERFYTEALGPAILLVFDRLHRLNLLPPAPKSLHGKQVEPTFVSVLAQAQKSVGTTSIEQFLRLAGSLVGVWPGAADKVDTDAALDLYGEAIDVPPKVVRSQDDTDALRSQREQQQARQQMLQATPALAQGAKNLSQTDVGGGRNALAAVLGTQ